MSRIKGKGIRMSHECVAEGLPITSIERDPDVIDTKVATEIMGWYCVVGWVWVDEDGKATGYKAIKAADTIAMGVSSSPPKWRPTRDSGHSFEMINKMREYGFWCALRSWCVSDDWMMSFYNINDAITASVITDETKELAASRAALLAFAKYKEYGKAQLVNKESDTTITQTVRGAVLCGIDADVARDIMGWTSFKGLWVVKRDGFTVSTGYGKENNSAGFKIWQPTRDVGCYAAMMAKMSELGYICSLYGAKDPMAQWSAGFAVHDEHDKMVILSHIVDDTQELACARAALLAVKGL